MKTLLLAAIAAPMLLLSFSGCATATQPTAMQTEIQALERKHPRSVAVQTNGGEATNPAWKSQIADEDLATAIKESILKNQLFSGVVSIGQADYVLNATIFKVDQPMVGFSMEVGIEIAWSLMAKGSKTPIWEKSIHTRARKGMGDAFAGVTRLRIATEASAKENITQAIMQIGRLQLQ